MGKPNTIGKVGSIISMISSLLVILIALITLLNVGLVSKEYGMFGVEIGSTFNIIALIWIVVLIFSIILFFLNIRFMNHGKGKILLGILSILVLWSSIIGVIGGILILVSETE